MNHSLIGFDVRKSLTPKLYYYIYRKQKNKVRYRGFNIKYFDFFTYLILILRLEFSIVNITMPYKENMFTLCNYCTYSSYRSLSTNLAIRYRNVVVCFNTDRVGFRKLMSKIKISKRIEVLIVGLGGAFKNIFEVIKNYKNISNIYLLNRTKSKYLNLIKENIREFRNIKMIKLIINTIPTYIFEDIVATMDFNSLRKRYTIDINYQKENKLQGEFKGYLYGETMLYGQAIENLKVKKKI
ncbi:hypothetical protein JSR06_00615 [Candidatus Vidania fulgoroideae]|uniref:Shikimate dehydrogenase substrate binding N-terminal domain-containing protein n=1 Tax=Candidatus Vidania fulgoroideorum TaxID=881286 RepID=A0A974XE31_9PROT|nr:hypothetical protein JSR06_00615 [Candidatus Vidania fulgoroideae]